MKHQLKKRKLGRTYKHRMAMLKNLAISIILYEKVKTTEAKAKEVRSVVEKMITKSKSGSLHDRRQVLSFFSNNENVTKKLFEVLGPRYKEVGGGYTSLTHLGNRSGDNAPVMEVRLVGGAN